MIFFSIFFAIAAACVPAIVWFAFFSQQDLHPEPKRLIIYTFTAGVFVSVIVLAIQFGFQNILPESPDMLFPSVVILALIEEVFKFFAANWAIRRDPAFDEPIDAMIYMIAASLGFATVENIFVLMGSFSEISSSPFLSALETAGLRFVGATLLHVLASAMVGYFWAKGRMRKNEGAYIAIGITIATFVHGIFNYLILSFQNKNLLIYPTFFLLFIAFFVMSEFEKLRKTRGAPAKKGDM